MNDEQPLPLVGCSQPEVESDFHHDQTTRVQVNNDAQLKEYSIKKKIGLRLSAVCLKSLFAPV